LIKFSVYPHIPQIHPQKKRDFPGKCLVLSPVFTGVGKTNLKNYPEAVDNDEEKKDCSPK
jgi:hypothetical protein